MALDFIDSCAHSASLSAQIPVSRKWTQANQVSYTSTQHRRSGWSLALVGAVSKTLSYVSERWVGCAYYFPTTSAFASGIIGMASGGLEMAFLKIETDFSISIISGGNNVIIWNSGVAANLFITGDVFHHYQFHVALSGSAPIVVTCGLQVDGQVWASGEAGNTAYNASNLLAGAALMNQISHSAPIGGGNTGYVCDIWCVNASSTDINGHITTLNTFLGDISIEANVPISDVNTDWTPSAGSSHFALVDEIPPDDDTTYVSSDTTSNLDDYIFQQLTGFTGTLLGAQLLIYIKKDNEGSRAIRATVGGTAQINISGTDNYLYDYYDYFIWPLDSDNGTAWTPAIYNAERFGVKLSV